MPISKHIKIWIFLILIFVPLSILLNFNVVDQEILRERQQLVTMFGKEAEARVHRDSIAIYKWCCADLAKWAEEYYYADNPDNIFGEETKSFIQNVFGSVYQFILRILSFAEWFKWLGPFLFIFVIIDALVSRKIRSENLAWQSPIKYNIGVHGVVFFSGLLIAYIFFPFGITIWFAPAWFGGIAFFMYMAISNFQRLV